MKTSLGLAALFCLTMAASGTALAGGTTDSSAGTTDPTVSITTITPVAIPVSGNTPSSGILPGLVPRPYQPLSAATTAINDQPSGPQSWHRHHHDADADQGHHGRHRHPGVDQPYARQQAASVQAKVNRLDTNHDGKLSRTEAAASPALTTLFDSIDSNHDGYLTAAEILAWMQQHQPGASTPTAGNVPAGSTSTGSHPGMLRTINGTCTGLPVGAC